MKIFFRYTVFIKNSISFSRFGDMYQRKNMREKGEKIIVNGEELDIICIYKEDHPPETLCPIFKLGDIVRWAGGNITELSVTGGVIGIGKRKF